MEKGLVHFYLGNGKGKSTALFGLALRALGRDFKVLIIQVLKARETGEILYLKKLNEKNLDIVRINTSPKFSWEMNEDEIKKSKFEILKGIEVIRDDFNDYDLILFDELLNAENIGFVDTDLIIDIIKSKNKNVELVFTGRSCSPSLKEYADYISVIDAEKHPYEQGVPARLGIEF